MRFKSIEDRVEILEAKTEALTAILPAVLRIIAGHERLLLTCVTANFGQGTVNLTFLRALTTGPFSEGSPERQQMLDLVAQMESEKDQFDASWKTAKEGLEGQLKELESLSRSFGTPPET